MASITPANVHVSQHPCLRAKLSQLRSKSTSSKETKAIVHEMALMIACEALANELSTSISGTDETPLGYEYETQTIGPARISIVPILRSGLAMVDGQSHPIPFLPSSPHASFILEVTMLKMDSFTAALETLLPHPVPIHHLGLFRQAVTLEPVEYYNNLPYHNNPPPPPPPTSSSSPTTNANNNNTPTAPHNPSHLAILLDPIIATGGTSSAAIQTLREWGVSKVVVMSVLGTVEGVRRAAGEWPEGTQIYVGGLDPEVDGKGMITPGVGDIGDRLFGTKGK
ncbi:hypothetical protein MMC25_002626 [Agyrium rufum]|nr:hypothetical protein [Agyrium rufum]